MIQDNNLTVFKRLLEGGGTLTKETQMELVDFCSECLAMQLKPYAYYGPTTAKEIFNKFFEPIVFKYTLNDFIQNNQVFEFTGMTIEFLAVTLVFPEFSTNVRIPTSDHPSTWQQVYMTFGPSKKSIILYPTDHKFTLDLRTVLENTTYLKYKISNVPFFVNFFIFFDPLVSSRMLSFVDSMQGQSSDFSIFNSYLNLGNGFYIDQNHIDKTKLYQLDTDINTDFLDFGSNAYVYAYSTKNNQGHLAVNIVSQKYYFTVPYQSYAPSPYGHASVPTSIYRIKYQQFQNGQLTLQHYTQPPFT